MQKRLIGNTQLAVSAIGLGTVKFGRNTGVRYPAHFEIPSDDTILNLLETAENLGINLIDTAPAYGMSEERLGKLMKRERFVICTKVGETFLNDQSHFDFSKEAIQKSVHASLKKLKTDYLDIVLVHSNGDDQGLIENDNVFETLADLKKTGLIRAFGMSTKTIAGGLLTVEQADIVMLSYHPNYQEEESVIRYACEKQKGVFIKKALESGHSTSVVKNLQFIFKQPGIHSVIIGTINATHLQENCEIFRPNALPAA